MRLSVVILNYNVRYFLELCLKSVEAAIEDIEAEIIVVDNDSSDDSCTMVKELFPNVILIENKENYGFSKGNNIGVAKAKGEYICILNPDTVVAEDTFSRILNFTKTEDHLGIVGCQLIDGSGHFLLESKRNVPKPKVALKKLLGNSNSYYANHVETNSIGEVDILVGAFMLVKKQVYDIVGGFDEEYFMYGEDIDLSYKILKAGYQNFYFGQTTVIHFKGESTLKDANYAKRFYGAMQIFYKKHFKQNIVFNAIVWLSIKLARGLSSVPKTAKKNYLKTIVFSDRADETLKHILPQPIELLKEIEADLDPNTLVLYDFNLLKAKVVITDMKKKSQQETIGFRLLPKNSNFILGSDSAVDRGEVIHF